MLDPIGTQIRLTLDTRYEFEVIDTSVTLLEPDCTPRVDTGSVLFDYAYTTGGYGNIFTETVPEEECDEDTVLGVPIFSKDCSVE